MKSLQTPWEREGWMAEATKWIDAALAQGGRRRMEPVEVLHKRPWSVFARVATHKGTAVFKAPAPPFSRFEAGVTKALAGWRPDVTVPVLAVEPERGWFLSEDAGATLRSAYPGIEQIEHWVKLLPLYAGLQMEMAAHVPELIGLGMFDRRLASQLCGDHAAGRTARGTEARLTPAVPPIKASPAGGRVVQGTGRLWHSGDADA
jgi:hypothetical protein